MVRLILVALALALALLPAGLAFAQYYEPYPQIPEPGSVLLLLFALAATVFRRSR